MMTGVTVAFCSSLLAAAVQPNTVGSKAAWYNQSLSSLPFVVDSWRKMFPEAADPGVMADILVLLCN